MRPFLLILTASLVMLGSSFNTPQQVKPIRILLNMFDSVKNVHTLRANIFALERLEERYISAESAIKLQTKPRKLYFVNTAKKLEILYNSETSHKASVKPHIFPYITINLDPNGNLMRKNQHYTINELGFEFIATSMALTIKNDKDAIKHFTYYGKVEKNGYNCHQIKYENNNYSYKTYVVSEKETASSIAYKLCINDYLLRYKNDLLNDFDYLKKGKVLMVPNCFCKNAVIYVDERSNLPISISLSDDIGLFESYSFGSIVINKPFQSNDFNIRNKEYGF